MGKRRIDCGASCLRSGLRREGEGSRHRAATFGSRHGWWGALFGRTNDFRQGAVPRVRRSGYIETVTEGGHVVGDTTQECLTCSGKGLIPEDMPLSQFREPLASGFGWRRPRPSEKKSVRACGARSALTVRSAWSRSRPDQSWTPSKRSHSGGGSSARQGAGSGRDVRRGCRGVPRGSLLG